LAAAGSLEPFELPELQAHLKHCEKCREVFRQYQILATQGITILADAYMERQAQVGWDGALACERLLARVRLISKPPGNGRVKRPLGSCLTSWAERA